MYIYLLTYRRGNTMILLALETIPFLMLFQSKGRHLHERESFMDPILARAWDFLLLLLEFRLFCWLQRAWKRTTTTTFEILQYSTLLRFHSLLAYLRNEI
jgi:hypothetical protein